MPVYKVGDYIKARITDEPGGDNAWVWVSVESADDTQHTIFGHLVNQPIVYIDLEPGRLIAVKYDDVVECIGAGKPAG